jgi:amino acid adenylation domain-containing protein
MARLLQELLSDRARRSPGGAALRAGGRTISCAGLDEMSGRFCAALRAAGVRPGGRVALLLPKGLEATAAVFGALQAGACFVPLDPAAPPPRQAGLLRHCGAKVLVASAGLRDKAGQVLAQGAAVRVVLAEDAGRAPRTRVGAARARPSDLAYILYTSGTTGQPKGVAISHRASLAFVDWACRGLGLRQGDVVCCPAPLQFDLSVLDVFASVAAGAAACPVPPGVGAFPRSLAGFIEREGVTVWYSVPSTLIRLMNEGGLERRDLSRLRLVLYAGEPFPVGHLRRLMSLLPRARFYNLYGPTETNVCAFHPVRRLPAPGRPVPIGRAAGGDRLAVLGEDLLPVRAGEEGELWVSGPSLMRGYWGQPALTRRAFSRLPGRQGVWYRTGDVVASGKRGELRFLGRRDTMVKTRGYRVELAEVEEALSSCPGVSEAAAVAVPDKDVGCRLKAVLVPSRGAALDAETVRAHCAGRLPSYMVPELFAFAEALPRTERGKLDRAALGGPTGQNRL